MTPLESPSAFQSITNTFQFEHHNGTDTGTELKVLKYIMIREGLVMSLTHATDKIVRLGEKGVPVNNDLKTEILDGLSQIRDTTIELLEIICMWRLSSADNRHDLPIPFIWEGQNYVLKIVSDLNFMGNVQQLVDLLSISPYKMVLNPLMLPNTLIEGDLWIGPEERASFDAGGLQEGDFYLQRLQLRRAERVLLQEIEVYDSQLQMGMDNTNNSFLGMEDSQSANMTNGEGFPVLDDTRPVSQGISGQGTHPLPMSSSSRNVHSAAPTTGGAVAMGDIGLDEWGFSVRDDDGGGSGSPGSPGMDMGGTGGVGDGMMFGDSIEGTNGSGIVFTDAHGSQAIEPENHDLSNEFGYNPPPDYLRPTGSRTNSRGGSRSRNGTGGSTGGARGSATSRIRGLPTQPLAPVQSPGKLQSQSPAFDDSLMTRDPVDSIKVVHRDFAGLEQYCTGVPGHGGKKAGKKPRGDDSGKPTGATAAAAAGPKGQGQAQGDMADGVPGLDPISTYDVEMVVSLTNPPPQMILAAAAIVILAEEGQEYPNDVTWNSFLGVATYTDLAWEMNSLNPGMIPQFKVRAIRPFLENMTPLNFSAHEQSSGPESDEFPPAPVTDDTQKCIAKMVMWVLTMTDSLAMAKGIVPRALRAAIGGLPPVPAHAPVGRTAAAAGATPPSQTKGKISAAAVGTGKKGGVASKTPTKAAAKTNGNGSGARTGNTNPVLEMPLKSGDKKAAKKAAGDSGGGKKQAPAAKGKVAGTGLGAGSGTTPKGRPPPINVASSSTGSDSKPPSTKANSTPMGPPPTTPHPSELGTPTAVAGSAQGVQVQRSWSADEYDNADGIALVSGVGGAGGAGLALPGLSPRLSMRTAPPSGGGAEPSVEDNAYGEDEFEEAPVPVAMGEAVTSDHSNSLVKDSTTSVIAEGSSVANAMGSLATTGGKSSMGDVGTLGSVDDFLMGMGGAVPDKSVSVAESVGMSGGGSDDYAEDFDGGNEIGSSIMAEDSVLDVAASGSKAAPSVADTAATGEDYGEDDFEA